MATLLRNRMPAKQWLNLRSLFREPLLHFLLIGLCLFVLYAQVSPGGSESRRIIVGQAQVDEMSRQFQGTFNRPPTPAELSGLVDTYVRDEIVYREGRAMSL